VKRLVTKTDLRLARRAALLEGIDERRAMEGDNGILSAVEEAIVDQELKHLVVCTAADEVDQRIKGIIRGYGT